MPELHTESSLLLHDSQFPASPMQAMFDIWVFAKLSVLRGPHCQPFLHGVKGECLPGAWFFAVRLFLMVRLNLLLPRGHRGPAPVRVDIFQVELEKSSGSAEDWGSGKNIGRVRVAPPVR